MCAGVPAQREKKNSKDLFGSENLGSHPSKKKGSITTDNHGSLPIAVEDRKKEAKGSGFYIREEGPDHSLEKKE